MKTVTECVVTVITMSVMSALDRFDRTLTRLSPVALGVLGTASAYYIAFSYGVGVIVLVLGREEATQLFGNAVSSPLLVFVGVPLIPIGLVALEASNFEDRILDVWRSTISPTLSRIPFVGSFMKWCWPPPKREPMVVTQDGLGGAVDAVSRSVSGGLLLPFLAYAIGNVCFKNVKNHLRRVVLGGLLYFAVKTILKLYLKQQEYLRQGSRRIRNYQEDNS